MVDHAPCAPYHAPNKPRRADANVLVFRNILLELDKGPLHEQWQFIHNIAVPYTSAVYSGGKSYHFIISLAEPCQTRQDYDLLCRRIYSVLGSRIDSACKNPSRLSRAPGHIRQETLKEQTLHALHSRVSKSALEDWLRIHEKPTPQKIPRKIPTGMDRLLYPSTERFLQEGAPDGEWNISLFKAACDTFQKGWTLQEFSEKAEGITGHLDANDRATIQSAWRKLSHRSA